MPFARTHRLTTKGAKTMMAAAIAKAEEFGIPVTVAIADAGGHLVLLERMDGGRFHTVHSSTTKAVCSASNKRPTTTQGAQAQHLRHRPCPGSGPRRRSPSGGRRWRGGFPILYEGECLGGIGVSGGDWEQDEAIARVAVEAVGASF